jgi:hypothetical protein
MGIRIHKVIGYGLVNIKHNEGKIQDSRFHPDGYLLTEEEEREERWTPAGYLDFLTVEQERLNKNRRENFNFLMECEAEIGYITDQKKWDFYDCVIHQPEYGLPNVICIVPVSEEKHWRRYDDIIDYTEHSHVSRTTGNDADDTVLVFNQGIPPYHHDFWDTRTHQLLDSVAMSLFPIATPDRKAILAKKLGFESIQDVYMFARPVVPYGVRLMCRYLNLFSDPVTENLLQPLRYIYWS